MMMTNRHITSSKTESPTEMLSMGIMMMIRLTHQLPLPTPGIMGRKDRRRRGRRPWWNTQHQELTRSSSKEVETRVVRTVQLRASPSPPRSPSVQAISVLTRVETSRSRASRSRSHHRGNMSNQQRKEARRSRSRSKESELPRRSSRAGSREGKPGKVQPSKPPTSQPCSEKPQPALTADTTDRSTNMDDQALPTYQDLLVHIVARRVHDLQAALMTCPAPFRTELEDQLASANLALRQRRNHRQSHLVLSSQIVLLRGEETEQFPLEIPLWTQHWGPSSTFLAPVPVSSAVKLKQKK